MLIPLAIDADCASLVATFSEYFVEKISKIRANIAPALQSMTARHFEVRRHAGPTLATFSEVTVDEVLSNMPSKSSPLNVLPCSLMKSCQDVFVPVIAQWPTCHSGPASFRPATSVHRLHSTGTAASEEGHQSCKLPRHHRRTIGRSRI